MMNTLPLKGSVQTIRASAALTSSYVAATVFSVDEHNFLGINVKYTKGDETSMQMKVEVSTDGGTTYYQQTAELASGGTITPSLAERTYSATGNYATTIHPIKVPTSVATAKGQIKISFKATGGTPTGTVFAEVVTGWV